MGGWLALCGSSECFHGLGGKHGFFSPQLHHSSDFILLCIAAGQRCGGVDYVRELFCLGGWVGR